MVDMENAIAKSICITNYNKNLRYQKYSAHQQYRGQLANGAFDSTRDSSNRRY